MSTGGRDTHRILEPLVCLFRIRILSSGEESVRSYGNWEDDSDS